MAKRIALKPTSKGVTSKRRGGGHIAGNGRGLFKPEFNNDVGRLCKLGLTDRDLSLWYGVSVITIGNWKQKHPEFFEAMQKGKQKADIKVASAMHKNACGFYYQEEQLVKKWRKKYDKDGKVTEAYEVIERVMVDRFCKPDTVAQIFYLKNRRPDQWRDVKSRPDEGPEKVKNTPDEILAEMRKRGIVMLEGAYEVVSEK